MNRKVVIIDDEPWTRDVIAKLAQWDTLELELVGEAADGETGLELIDRVQPDIIITDVRMPRLNGIELVHRLRENGHSAPVLIVSGYDDFSYVRSALRLNVTDYLLKPVKADELNRQLARCVELLDADTDTKPKVIMEVGFFADGWEDVYAKIREKLESALYTRNRTVLREQFDQLERVICRYEGQQPATAVMIGIYYALLYPLQKYADIIGGRRDEILGGRLPVFVFSCDNSVGEVLAFLQELYWAAVAYAEKHQHRTRLDIDAVCRYIRENYTQGITLEQTAGLFHVTKEYLSKSFKTEVKVGFAEYVTALRMKRAYELIAEYGAPLKEVGAMVGYYDLAHFYKTFRKFYGKTPGELRDGLNSANEKTHI